MSAIRYEAVKGWEQLPADCVYSQVTDVAVDAEDNVYLLTRNDPRVLVYEPDGRFIRSWGEGVLTEVPHGIAVGPGGAIYCVLQDDHTVRKFTEDGRQVAVMGTSELPSDTGIDWSIQDYRTRVATISKGGPPFNNPTGIAVGPSGDLYVSDGYGNARVHHFTPAGELIGSWGQPGVEPGQFHVPHNLAVASDGRVLVADRENDRIQVFASDGQFIEEWSDLHRPAAIAIDGNGMVFVCEFYCPPGWYSWVNGRSEKAKPSRLSILDPGGSVVARIGGGDNPCGPGDFLAAHGVAVDSRGSVYVAEVRPPYVIDLQTENCHTLQKLVRSA